MTGVQTCAWYCLEYSNSHTVARDFFVDTVRRSPFGNRHHPFATSPALFIYRNPLDVLVSEANYYHRDGKTAFAGYLSGLSFEQRVERLIDDPWLLGSIRDRISGFLPWLDFPNVIPISFEELIGPEGGGSRDLQLQLIWSLQLKLHVPGEPAGFAGRVFDPSSQTFYQGRSGAYRERLTPPLMERYRALNQDFMRALGYAIDGPDGGRPLRAAEFLRRPLRIPAAVNDDVPFTLQYDYLGFNLVRYRDWIYAVPQGAGPSFDPRHADPSVLARLPRARDLPDLQQQLLLGAAPRRVAGGLRADQVLPRLTGEPEPGSIRFWLDQTLGRVRRALQRLWRWLTGRGWTLETGAERK